MLDYSQIIRSLHYHLFIGVEPIMLRPLFEGFQESRTGIACCVISDFKPILDTGWDATENLYSDYKEVSRPHYVLPYFSGKASFSIEDPRIRCDPRVEYHPKMRDSVLLAPMKIIFPSPSDIEEKYNEKLNDIQCFFVSAGFKVASSYITHGDQFEWLYYVVNFEINQPELKSIIEKPIKRLLR